jgi:hypothetical protein
MKESHRTLKVSLEEHLVTRKLEKDEHENVYFSLLISQESNEFVEFVILSTRCLQFSLHETYFLSLAAETKRNIYEGKMPIFVTIFLEMYRCLRI